jgi:oligosaccharyltransferase complex subunit gamma
MKIASLLALVALPVLSLAAKKDSAARFDKLHKKSLSSTPLKLDDRVYNDLTDSPRDFTSVILLTALPAQFGCEACKAFQPEFDIIASSWAKGDKKAENRVLFGVLDFPDGKATFQKVSAPVSAWVHVTDSNSLCFKLLPSFSCSLLPLGHTPKQTASLCG